MYFVGKKKYSAPIFFNAENIECGFCFIKNCAFISNQD